MQIYTSFLISFDSSWIKIGDRALEVLVENFTALETMTP